MRAVLSCMVFVLTVLVLIPGPTQADTYYHGYVSPMGYTYNSSTGKWYKGGYGYTRSTYYTPGSSYYGSCGNYYTTPGAYYYNYSYSPDAYYPPATDYTPPASTYTAPPANKPVGWRSQLLDWAKEVDKKEQADRSAELDHKMYLEAVQAFGLSGRIRVPAYPVPPASQYVVPPYMSPALSSSGYYNRSYTQTYGYPPVQGQTQYGYGLNSVKDLYGTTDLNTLYQQSYRTAQQHGVTAGTLAQGFQDQVSDATDKAARLAEISTKGNALERLARALEPQPSTTTTTTSGTIRSSAASSGGVGLGPGSDGTGDVAPPLMARASLSDQEFLTKLAIPRCGSCHQGPEAKKGFQIASYPNLSFEKKKIVWARILTDDKTKVMPPPPNLPLNGQETQVFLSH